VDKKRIGLFGNRTGRSDICLAHTRERSKSCKVVASSKLGFVSVVETLRSSIQSDFRHVICSVLAIVSSCSPLAAD
jgi:hypothetical protein